MKEIMHEVTAEELLQAGIKMSRILEKYRVSKRDREILLECMGAYMVARGGRDEQRKIRSTTIKQTIFSNTNRQN
jgi:hypothetical protein